MELTKEQELTQEQLLWMYERMVLIRTFEDRYAAELAAGKPVRGGHLYAGQEAVGVGVCAALREDDYVASNHRGHGHCIAKGVDVKAMMAELFGKATGACKGKGGTMHIADFEKGMLGANGIVGGGYPLACGAGLSAKLRGTDQVTICFFGDGASNQGTFHEGLNLASVWKLPVVFVCENNMYAESTPIDYSANVKDIAERAVAYGIPGVVVDGQDVFAVYEAAAEAVKRARAGQGPTLIEAKTYRYYGHFLGDDPLRYRTKEEEDYYRSRDCIQRFRAAVQEQGLLSEEELSAINAGCHQALDEAVAFAEASPYPAPEALFEDVYVSYP